MHAAWLNTVLTLSGPIGWFTFAKDSRWSSNLTIGTRRPKAGLWLLWLLLTKLEKWKNHADCHVTLQLVAIELLQRAWRKHRLPHIFRRLASRGSGKNTLLSQIEITELQQNGAAPTPLQAIDDNSTSLYKGLRKHPQLSYMIKITYIYYLRALSYVFAGQIRSWNMIWNARSEFCSISWSAGSFYHNFMLRRPESDLHHLKASFPQSRQVYLRRHPRWHYLRIGLPAKKIFGHRSSQVLGPARQPEDPKRHQLYSRPSFSNPRPKYLWYLGATTEGQPAAIFGRFSATENIFQTKLPVPLLFISQEGCCCVIDTLQPATSCSPTVGRRGLHHLSIWAPHGPSNGWPTYWLYHYRICPMMSGFTSLNIKQSVWIFVALHFPSLLIQNNLKLMFPF